MTAFLRPLAGYRRVEVHHGESLQALALRELGDASRWVDIANLNGLRPPYLTAYPEAAGNGVALYGSLLLVPAAAPEASTATEPVKVFGTDVALRNGRLEAEGGDFALVAGVPNLTQALRHRLDTEPGELLFHPDYGCLVRRLIGTVAGPVAGQLAREYVRAALLADERIQDTDGLAASVQGDTLRVSGNAIPVAGKALPVEAAF